MAESSSQPQKYCVGCGNGLLASAAICPKCGTPAAPLITKSGKKKAVAVLLAVLFGFWTYLYTFSVDSVKFFASLALVIGLSVLWGLLEWTWWEYGGFHVGVVNTVMVGAYVAAFGTWLGAVLTAASGDKDKYESM